jgi:ribonuclease E
VRSVSSVALQLLRGIEEILMKGATHNLVVRTRTDVALYVLNHKRGHLRDLENAFKVTLSVVADPNVSGVQSYVIDRGEQVHTLEAAKALLAAQAAAAPLQSEEAFDDEEAFDAEMESEVETEETEGLADDASDGEGGQDGRRRKRRRRRRGRGEARDGVPARDENEAPADALAGDGVSTEDGSADEDEPDEQAGAARSEQNGERRPRRRGRRGGRRRRGSEDGLAASIADELAPPAASEVESAVADFDGNGAAPSPFEPHPESAAPAPASEPAAAYHAPQGEAASAPSPGEEASASETEKPAHRRSTVREKVSQTGSAASEHVAPVAEPESTGSAEPVPAGTSEAQPRRAGWWSRRFGGGR